MVPLLLWLRAWLWTQLLDQRPHHPGMIRLYSGVYQETWLFYQQCLLPEPFLCPRALQSLSLSRIHVSLFPLQRRGGDRGSGKCSSQPNAAKWRKSNLLISKPRLMSTGLLRSAPEAGNGKQHCWSPAEWPDLCWELAWGGGWLESGQQ